MQENYDNHPLDLSYLKEMVGHNPEFMVEIFDTFIEQTPIYLAELEEALEAQNWDKVGNCAHKIKPTFSYVGRHDVKDFIQTIEDKARHVNGVEQIPFDLKNLKEIIQQIYEQLEEAKKDLRAKG